MIRACLTLILSQMLIKILFETANMLQLFLALHYQLFAYTTNIKYDM